MTEIQLNKRNKTIKIVNRKDTIRLQHTGRTGPTGDIGPIGPQGPQGLPVSVNNIEHINGNIDITPDNLDDTSTAHKFVASTDLTKLSNLSGINTGDETQSTIKTKLGAATSTSDGYATATQVAKLAGIMDGAEVNVQADWSAVNGDAQILNKPTLGTAAAKDIPATGNASATEVVYGTDTRLTDSRPASDVSAWAKTPSKPTYTNTEVGAAATVHTHVASDISDFNSNVSNNTDVSANTAARHTHSNKATLDATTASFTTAQETKLSGIATGATANATDAQLRDRSTHTGTQAQSTIANLTTDLAAKANFPNTDSHVPVRDGSGAQSSLRYTSGTTGYTIGFRTADGQIGVGEPTDNTHATNKGYVDTALNAKANASDTVNLTGNQTVAGVKTFSSSPAVPTAATTTQAVNKGQMDTADALKLDKANPGVRSVYSVTAAGVNETIQVNATANNTIPIRNALGQFDVGTPASSTQVTNKSYVDGLAPIYGTGNPNGIVSATVGRIYSDTTGANNTHLWIKAVGTGNTGWQIVPKSTTTANITVSATAPTSPVIGDLWVIA